jgi:hypothetical protein
MWRQIEVRVDWRVQARVEVLQYHAGGVHCRVRKKGKEQKRDDESHTAHTRKGAETRAHNKHAWKNDWDEGKGREETNPGYGCVYVCVHGHQD